MEFAVKIDAAMVGDGRLYQDEFAALLRTLRAFDAQGSIDQDGWTIYMDLQADSCEESISTARQMVDLVANREISAAFTRAAYAVDIELLA